MPLPNRVVYSDLPINLTKHPIRKDIIPITNEDAVKRSVKNLVLSNYFDRPFQPDLGSHVRAYLFENFTPATEENIEAAIGEVIENYEPRVELLGVNVTAKPDRNGFVATIFFRIVNQTDPAEVEVFLERVR